MRGHYPNITQTVSASTNAVQPGYLTAEAVSTRVNDPRNDDLECLRPLP